MATQRSAFNKAVKEHLMALVRSAVKALEPSQCKLSPAEMSKAILASLSETAGMATAANETAAAAAQRATVQLTHVEAMLDPVLMHHKKYLSTK
jgi:hypothetical protein